MLPDALYPERPADAGPRFRVAWIRHALWLAATLLALLVFGLVLVAIVGASVVVIGYGGLLAVVVIPAFADVTGLGEVAIALSALFGGLALVLLGVGAIAVLVAHLLAPRTESPGARVLDLESQPKLREFLGRLAGDVRAPMPAVVWLEADANAGMARRRGPPHMLLGLALVRVLDVAELKAVIAHEFAHYGQSGSRLGHWAHRATYSIVRIVLGSDRFDEWLLVKRSSAKPLVASAASMLITSADLVRRALAALLEWVLWSGRSLGREMEFDADAQAVREAGSDAVVSSLWKSTRAQLAFADTLDVAAHLARQGQFAADLFAVFERRLAELDDSLADSDDAMAQALRKPYQRGQSLHFPAGPSMVSHRFDSHPSPLERERAAKAPYLAPAPSCEPGPRAPAWTLLDEPERLCSELTDECYTRMGFTPSESLDVDAFETILAAELAGFAFAERHHGFYDGRLLRLGNFDELLAALERREFALATLDEEVGRWRGPALGEYMAALSQAHTQLCELEALCAKPMHERPQWVRIGERSVRCDAVESARATLEQQVKGMLETVEFGDRTLFAWTWLVLDRERRLELVARYRYLLELQTLLPRLVASREALEHALQVVARQDRERTKAASQAATTAAGQAQRELAALLHHCEQLRSPALRNPDAAANLRAQVGIELPDQPAHDTDQLPWAHAVYEALETTRHRISVIHDRAIGAILELQSEAEAKAPPRP